MEFLAWICVVIITVGCTVAAIVAAFKYPLWWLGAVLFAVGAVSIARADDSLRFEVSIAIEEEIDRPAVDEAMTVAAEIFRNQLGIELITTHTEIHRVTEHTKPEQMLIDLQSFRSEHPAHRAADATLLFTRRELTRNYLGFATDGPACSTGAAGVIRLLNNGLDGYVTAHELLHTIGVPHDSEPGWLMSESMGPSGASIASPGTVATVKAAPLDCMLAIEPRPAVPSSGGEPLYGGGAFEWLGFLVGCGIAMLYWFVRSTEKLSRENTRLSAEVLQLKNDAPSELSLMHLRTTVVHPMPRDGIVTFGFETHQAAIDFMLWAREQSSKALQRRIENNEMAR